METHKVSVEKIEKAYYKIFEIVVKEYDLNFLEVSILITLIRSTNDSIIDDMKAKIMEEFRYYGGS